jgi:succinoglycan biosynthesis transport protein ExoP
VSANDSGVPPLISDVSKSKTALSPAPRNGVNSTGVRTRTWPGETPLATPQAHNAPTDASRFFKALRRRWLLTLSLGIIGSAVAGTAAWILLGMQYTAFAMIHVAATPQKLAFATPDYLDAHSEFLTYQRTEAARIKSRYVINAALKQDRVKELGLTNRESDPVAWLEDEIKVDFKEGSELINVSMTGTRPEELIVLVDAVTQAYLQEVVNLEHKKRKEQLDELEDIYLAAKKKLREKRDALLRLADRLGTSDSQALTQKQLVFLANYGEIKKQHIQVRYELTKAQARLAAFQARAKNAPPPPLPDLLIDQAVTSDPQSRFFLERIARLKEIISDYESTAARAGEGSLRRAEEKMEAAQKAFDGRRVELTRELEERYRSNAGAQSEVNLAQLQDEVASLTAHEKSLNLEVAELGKQLEKIGTSSTELEILRVEIKQDENMSEKIADQLESLRVELRRPARITLYQPAGLQGKDRKKQLLAAGLAPLGVFLLVGLCISWWENRSRRIQSVGEVGSLGVRLLGAVPMLGHARSRGALGRVDDPTVYDAGFIESVDAIRTQLLRDAHLDGTRVVMVTSAVEGEGKTTLVSHLAHSLARAGRKTLLIDCDLRRPDAQQFFNVPAQPGFSEVLRGEIDAALATRETADGLFVLPAGQWNRQVLRILAQGRAQDLFDRVRQDYDFVLIDSHPILSAADSLLIGQHADGVILSVLRDRSQMHVAFAARQRLESLGIRVLGAVVSGIQEDELFNDVSYSLPRYPNV